MPSHLLKALVVISIFFTWATASAQVDYGHMYSPNLPNETSMEGLPYAIPCAKAKNQYGADFYRCTWFTLPRNITKWSAEQQRNIPFSNQLSGNCRRGKCFVENESGVYGIYNQDISFSISIYYYIYESKDGYPIAYLLSGGPDKNKRTVTYAEAKTTLKDFLLDRGINQSTIKDMIDKYDLDTQTLRDSTVDDTPEPSDQPLTKPTKNIVVTKAWCNPRADDECTVNDKKVPKADLKQYLPEIYEMEVLNAGGYCEYPICYDSSDRPVGIR